MKRFVDILSVPVCAIVGCKAAATIWPIDPVLALLTGLSFFILFCDFLLEAWGPKP